MAEKYTGQDRRYAGEVDITYSLKRCIHAEFCVHHLSSVFDKNKRPWINPDGAQVDQIVEVVERCPSGALHYDRKDGVVESALPKNVVRVRQNGPLEIRGDLSINGATVDLQNERRVTLCRCGASNNKPFCDNAHKTINFQAVEVAPDPEAPEMAQGGRLSITALENAALDLHGGVEIVTEAGERLFSGESTRLCRCGGSSTKPFCDGTHLRNGFRGE